jgi:hypothetical protein
MAGRWRSERQIGRSNGRIELSPVKLPTSNLSQRQPTVNSALYANHCSADGAVEVSIRFRKDVNNSYAPCYTIGNGDPKVRHMQ